MESTPQNNDWSKVPWDTSLATLFLDPLICLKACLCPCYAYYDASKEFEDTPADFYEAFWGGCCCFCSFDLRSRLRKKYNLKGHDLSDFCIHCFCHYCGIAQIKREAMAKNMKNRMIFEKNPQEIRTNELEQVSSMQRSLTHRYDTFLRNTFGNNSSIVQKQNQKSRIINQQDRELTAESTYTVIDISNNEKGIKKDVTKLAEELSLDLINDTWTGPNGKNESGAKFPITPSMPLECPLPPTLKKIKKDKN